MLRSFLPLRHHVSCSPRGHPEHCSGKPGGDAEGREVRGAEVHRETPADLRDKV